MLEKTCTKCGRPLPATPVFFHRQAAGRFGLRPDCKDCARIYREARREQIRAYSAGHKEQNAALARAWYERHREELRVRRVAHREERAAYDRARRAIDREKRQALREACPENSRVQNRNRYARKKGNGGTHTAEDIQAQFDRQKGRCFWCKKKLGKKYHTDHVVPLVLDGSNGPENLVVACPTCNLKKNATHPMDWCGMLL